MLNLTRLSFFFLIAAVFLAPLIGGQFEFVFAGPLYMLVLLSAFLLFISGKSTSPSLFTKGFDVIALALFVILTIIAGLGTAGAHVSVVQIVSIACFFAVFLLGRRTGRLGSETPILTAIALAGILLGVSAIAEYQVMHAEYLKQAGSEYRVFGSYLTPGFFNPGFFAGYLAMALPITLGLYCGSKKLWLTSLAGLACLAQLAAILLTGARFGAIALLFGLICFIIALTLGKALSRQTLLRLAVIAILSLVVLALFHGPMTYRVAAAHEQSHSLAFRLLTWQATANIAKNHILFGTGPGTFHLIFPQYCIAGFTRLAHNSYLQIAAETGIPALLAFIVGVGAVLLASIRGLRRSNSGNTAILSGLIAGIAASSIRNLTDSDWYVPGVALVFWFALGLASGMSRRHIEEAPAKVSPKRWVSILIGTITLILIAVIAVLNLAASPAANGRRAVETNNPKLAMAEYQLASRFAPWSADY
ncbi:MAG: O-antigen ligase family protein, partial [Armatimonadota bacterium]|nr:O-antigen ligase family protein [Armatimonadota bacterium]